MVHHNKTQTTKRTILFHLLIATLCVLKQRFNTTVAAPCFTVPHYPKLIGYDTADVEATDVAVKSDTSQILIIFRTLEPNIVGSATDTAQIASYNPGSDSYDWVRVYENTKTRNQNIKTDFIKYSTNENLALFSFFDTNDIQNFVWIDPSAIGQGALQGIQVFKLDSDFGRYGASSLIVSSDVTHDYIFFFMGYLSGGTSYRLIRQAFDGSSWAGTIRKHFLSITDTSLAIPSLNINAAGNTLVTTANMRVNTGRELWCRTELWIAATLVDFSGNQRAAASDRGASQRYCSFPAIYDIAAGEFMIDLVVNYPGLGETGFMMVFANSQGRQGNALGTTPIEEVITKEIHFYDFLWDPNNYQFGYGVGKTAANEDVVVEYRRIDLNNSPTGTVYIWQLKQFVENPALNDFSTANFGTKAAFIRGKIVPVDPTWIPIEGFYVGGTTKVGAWRERCTNLEFQIFPHYENVVTTTNKVGFMSPIEYSTDSCSSTEEVQQTNSMSVSSLAASYNDANDQHENTFTIALPTVTLAPPNNLMSAYSLATPTAHSGGEWEQTLDLSVCHRTVNDQVVYRITPPIFDGDDQVYMPVGSTYNLAFPEWTLQGTTCTQTFQYQTVFSGANTPTSDITSTMVNGPPWSVNIDAQPPSVNTKYNMEVLATSWAGQCQNKDIEVTPISCPLNTISGSLFVASATKWLTINHEIGQGPQVYTAKFTPSISFCGVEIKIFDDPAATEHTGNIVTITTQPYYSNGQYFFDFTVDPIDPTLDPGGTPSAPIYAFKISLASPDHATASGGALNPQTLNLSVQTPNVCRGAVIADQTFSPMSTFVNNPGTPPTQTISPFTHSLMPTNCGTQTVSIIEDGLNSFLYSEFITVSGFTFTLQSNNDLHAGDHYLRIKVVFSTYAMEHININEMYVKIEDSCRHDDFSILYWLESSQPDISQFDHVPTVDTRVFNLRPLTVINTLPHCTADMRWFFQIEQPPASNTFVDYPSPAGSDVVWDPLTNTVTLASTAAQYTYDQQIWRFKVSVASVADLSTATGAKSAYIQFKWVHPCRLASLADVAGFTNQRLAVENCCATHPTPDVKSYTFPVVVNPNTVSCGPQTVSLSATPTVPSQVPTGLLSEFLSATMTSDDTFDIELAPIDLKYQLQVFTISVSTQLDNYPAVSLSSTKTFTVTIDQSCSSATITSFLWNSNGTTNTGHLTIITDNTTVTDSFTASSTIAACPITFVLCRAPDNPSVSVSTCTANAPLFPQVSINYATQIVTMQTTDQTLVNLTETYNVYAGIMNPVTGLMSSFQTITATITWASRCALANLQMFPISQKINQGSLTPALTSTAPTISIVEGWSECLGPGVVLSTTTLPLVVQNFNTLTGTFDVEAPRSGLQGNYSFQITASVSGQAHLVAYQQVDVYISACSPNQIVPPSEKPETKQHTLVETENATFVTFDLFTIDPVACDAQLTYTALLNETAIDQQNLNITLVDQYDPLTKKALRKQLLIKTVQAKYAGVATFEIIATHGYSSNVLPYKFTIEFIAVPNLNEPKRASTLSLGIDQIDPVSQVEVPQFSLDLVDLETLFPESTFEITVDFYSGSGEESCFWYDAASNQIIGQQNGKLCPPGRYPFCINVKEIRAQSQTDDEDSPPLIESQECFTIDVTKESQGQTRDYQTFEDVQGGPAPEIVEITQFGLVTVKWDKSMAIPVDSDQFQDFVGNLNRTVYFIDNKTGQILMAPAFEVIFLGDGGINRKPLDEMQWSFVNWTSENEFTLQLDFREPRIVSANPIYDKLEIRFWDPNPFTAKQDSKRANQQIIAKEIPLQNDDSWPTKVQEAVTEAVFQVTLIGGILSFLTHIIMGLSLTLLWALLHAIQLIIHLPLFPVQFPKSCLDFYVKLIKIAQFDLIETEEWLPQLMGINADEQPYSRQFELLDYPAQNFISNSGFIFLVLVVETVILVALALLYIFTLCSRKVKKIHRKLKEKIFWSGIFRTITEFSLEFALLALLDIKTQNWSTVGYIASYVLSWACLLSLTVYSFWVSFYLSGKYKSLTNSKMKKKFQTAYAGMNLKDTPIAVQTSSFFIMRRIIFAAAAVVAKDFTWIIFQVIFQNTLGQLYFTCIVKPYPSPLMNKLEIFNEIGVILVLYHMLLFTDFVADPLLRYQIGYSCYAITCLIILVNMYVGLKKTVLIWLKKILQWVKKKDWLERMTIRKYRKQLYSQKEAMKKARLEGSEYVSQHTLDNMIKANEDIPLWIQNKSLFDNLKTKQGLKGDLQGEYNKKEVSMNSVSSSNREQISSLSQSNTSDPFAQTNLRAKQNKGQEVIPKEQRDIPISQLLLEGKKGKKLPKEQLPPSQVKPKLIIPAGLQIQKDFFDDIEYIDPYNKPFKNREQNNLTTEHNQSIKREKSGKINVQKVPFAAQTPSHIQPSEMNIQNQITQKTTPTNFIDALKNIRQMAVNKQVHQQRNSLENSQTMNQSQETNEGANEDMRHGSVRPSFTGSSTIANNSQQPNQFKKFKAPIKQNMNIM